MRTIQKILTKINQEDLLKNIRKILIKLKAGSNDCYFDYYRFFKKYFYHLAQQEEEMSWPDVPSEDNHFMMFWRLLGQKESYFPGDREYTGVKENNCDLVNERFAELLEGLEEGLLEKMVEERGLDGFLEWLLRTDRRSM